MSQSLPEFVFLDAKAKRRLGGISFYGPGDLDAFAWHLLGSLVFVIVFRVIGSKDEFEASFEWAEDGLLERNADYLSERLFDDSIIDRSHARALIQSLSRAVGDSPDERVFSWKFWEPTSDLDDTEKWFAEVMLDEQRQLSDDEARNRVEAAVDRAIDDIRRCALPWFERKLENYKAKLKVSAQR